MKSLYNGIDSALTTGSDLMTNLLNSLGIVTTSQKSQLDLFNSDSIKNPFSLNSYTNFSSLNSVSDDIISNVMQKILDNMSFMTGHNYPNIKAAILSLGSQSAVSQLNWSWANVNEASHNGTNNISLRDYLKAPYFDFIVNPCCLLYSEQIDLYNSVMQLPIN